MRLRALSSITARAANCPASVLPSPSLRRLWLQPNAFFVCRHQTASLTVPFSVRRSLHSTSHESQPPIAPQPSSQQPPRPPRQPTEETRDRNRRTLKYAIAVALFTLGASYAAVPLYRLFCQRTGYGGTTQRDADYSKLGAGVSDREMIITFTADTAPDLHWSFVPSQTRLKVRVGEPVLAFYQATNNRDQAVTGVATYNVTPMKTGFYFHKIQCFCFDEQRLRAKETVDMPVFFYIDPAINDDRRCNDVKDITLSYTFFAIKDDEDEDEVTDSESNTVTVAASENPSVQPAVPASSASKQPH